MFEAMSKYFSTFSSCSVGTAWAGQLRKRTHFPGVVCHLSPVDLQPVNTYRCHVAQLRAREDLYWVVAFIPVPLPQLLSGAQRVCPEEGGTSLKEWQYPAWPSLRIKLQ